MKTVLGLDLGVNSIGWALVSENEVDNSIIGMGSRIIPLSPDDKDEFTKGNAISKNQARTVKRTQRKGLDRYQLRRTFLSSELQSLNIMPGKDLFLLSALELYGLRHQALTEKISLNELGRIMLHLNQKRGYKSVRRDANLNKKETEYVTEIKTRYQQLKDLNITIGTYFFQKLKVDPFFRIKELVFPREAYIDEFDKICENQQKFFPDVLTAERIKKIRDEIIFFQRPLKSQKGLVSICEFEGFQRVNKDGKKVFVGPKVAPRSSPLFQVCKIWESINTIRIHNRSGDELIITPEKKQRIYDHLNENEKLTITELFRILEISKDGGWYCNKQLGKGIQGNTTLSRIQKVLSNSPEAGRLLKFQLEIIQSEQEVYLADRKTGEISQSAKKQVVDSCYEKEPLHQLWHLLYSVPDKEVLVNTLMSRYSIPVELASSLANLDLTTSGYGNKSVKAIRKILPYLMAGFVYSDACALAGYNHSDSLTIKEKAQRVLVDRLSLLSRNSLRQPVVEKILNQMINLVNAVIDEYGKPDEIRVELARELKQSKEERNDAFKKNTQRERENIVIIDRLRNEYGLPSTRNNVVKWRLFHEINREESKLNATCIYCGQPFGITQALKGEEVDIEHIIPKSRLFDDSISNKTLSHKKCNTEKGSKTAFDYMKSKSNEEFQQFLDRVAEIDNPVKRRKLLMPGDKIPDDFIERQLRQTQYISRKSMELLSLVCRNVWATSGSVTEYLRRVWGWQDITMQIMLRKLKDAGLTDLISVAEGQDEFGNPVRKENITGWTKRDDHRHHAIDALTIACTKQGYIQRINSLNADYAKWEKQQELQDSAYREHRVSLEKYFTQQRPFSTAEVEKQLAGILVSYKPGKKVATIGRRLVSRHGKKQVGQTGIITPRGPLSEESVYGKICALEREVPLKILFTKPDRIVKENIKVRIQERLAKFENDPRKASQSCKREPIYLDSDHKVELKHASIYVEEYVIKYPVSGLTVKDLPSIVDPNVRKIIQARLESFGNNPKEAFKDLENNPILINPDKKIPIRSVRCYTGLKAVEPVKRDENGKPIGFVKPGNNHHVAIYRDSEGNRFEHIVTFWHAVERKKYGIPVIIRDTNALWDNIHSINFNYPHSFLEKLPVPGLTLELSMQQNEMFILGLPRVDPEEILAHEISECLYRVQKLGPSDYWFRHHLETEINDTLNSKMLKRYHRVKSLKSFFELNPVKVKITLLGQINISSVAR